MQDLAQDLIELKEDFNKVLFCLENFSTNNSDNEIYNINGLIKKIEVKKNAMQRRYDDWKLKKYNDYLNISIKEINKKFDSIIKQKTSEIEEVGLKIEEQSVKKKLLNYQR